jgi:ABC-type nickel/cobalt efflux system permease component RcnA
LRVAKRAFFQRVAVVMMMTAALAFALQCIFVAASEAATGDTSHYYLGFLFTHPHVGGHSHVIAHRHADGTSHQHAIDDDDAALAKHVKEPGSNMALVVCVVPCLGALTISELAGGKLTIENPCPLWVADLNGLRRPPRPPSIA